MYKLNGRSHSPVSYSTPLTVDVSVEYELPKEVSPPPNAAPLLIIHPLADYLKAQSQSNVVQNGKSSHYHLRSSSRGGSTDLLNSSNISSTTQSHRNGSSIGGSSSSSSSGSSRKSLLRGGGSNNSSAELLNSYSPTPAYNGSSGVHKAHSYLRGFEEANLGALSDPGVNARNKSNASTGLSNKSTSTFWSTQGQGGQGQSGMSSAEAAEIERQQWIYLLSLSKERRSKSAARSQQQQLAAQQQQSNHNTASNNTNSSHSQTIIHPHHQHQSNKQQRSYLNNTNGGFSNGGGGVNGKSAAAAERNKKLRLVRESFNPQMPPQTEMDRRQGSFSDVSMSPPPSIPDQDNIAPVYSLFLDFKKILNTQLNQSRLGGYYTSLIDPAQLARERQQTYLQPAFYLDDPSGINRVNASNQRSAEMLNTYGLSPVDPFFYAQMQNYRSTRNGTAQRFPIYASNNQTLI